MTPRSSCPINGTLELFGDRWSLLILRDMAFARKTTFKGFEASAEKIATNILSDRLARLEAGGFVHKDRDPEDGRARRYRLTRKGASLIPVLSEMALWGETHLRDADTIPGLKDTMKGDRQAAFSALIEQLDLADP